MFGGFEDIQNVSKNNIEATMKSFSAVSRGAQAIATEMADYSKRSFENGSKAMEKLLSVRSLDKAIEIHSEYAKSTYDDYSAQVTKLSGLYADLAKEAFGPCQSFAVKMSPAK
jgi:hypothetical protein